MIPLERITHADECDVHRGQACSCDREQLFRDHRGVIIDRSNRLPRWPASTAGTSTTPTPAPIAVPRTPEIER